MPAQSSNEKPMELNMSATTTAGLCVPEASRVRSKAGLFKRIIEARMRRAEIRVGEHLSQMSDGRLHGLGFSPRQIAELRATGRLTWAGTERS